MSSRVPRRVLVALAALLVTATSCTGGDGDAGSDAAPTSTEPAADCTPARSPDEPEPGASTTATFDVDGTTRTYLIAVPEDDDGSTALPLVLNFHGWAGSAEDQERNTGLAELGTARGFVVVTPEATGDPREWNMFDDPKRTPDFDHVDALVASLLETRCIDESRVFAVGHSNGAAFTGFLGCREPYRFAAIAMVAATIPSTCPDGVTPSVLVVSGDADPQVPYDGGSVGGGPTQIPGAVDTVAAYRERYGCSAEPATSEPVPGVRSERSSDCTSGAIIGFDTVEGGTHPWPGGEAAQADPSNSQAGRDYDATGAILEFFESVPPQT